MFFDHLRSESADHSPKPHNQDHGRCGIHGYTHRHLEAYTAHYSMIGRFSGLSVCWEEICWMLGVRSWVGEKTSPFLNGGMAWRGHIRRSCGQAHCTESTLYEGAHSPSEECRDGSRLAQLSEGLVAALPRNIVADLPLIVASASLPYHQAQVGQVQACSWFGKDGLQRQ